MRVLSEKCMVVVIESLVDELCVMCSRVRVISSRSADLLSAVLSQVTTATD